MVSDVRVVLGLLGGLVLGTLFLLDILDIAVDAAWLVGKLSQLLVGDEAPER